MQIAAADAKAKGLKTQFETLGSSAGVAHSSLTNIGMTLSATVSPAIRQFGSYAVQSAYDIDAAYRDMRKTVQGTEEDFQRLLQSAKEFSQQSFVSADTILEIEAMAGQLGIAVDSLEEFAVTVSNLNIATNITDASTIAQQIGQLSNILGDMSADQVTNFGDALVRLGNNNAALESDIMDVTTRIGSMASIVGMTTPEILAWSTAIASTGQKSEAAGTAISNTMSDIESAVSKGGSGLSEFAAVAAQAGDASVQTAGDFAALWKADPSAAFKAFVEGLHAVDEAGGSADGTLIQLGITGVRQKQALLGLAQTTGTLSSSLAMSSDAWNGVSDQWGAAGDAAREAANKSQGFSGALAILKNNAQVLGGEMAESLTPVLQAATPVVQALADGFSQMPAPMQTAFTSVVLMTSAIGPALTAMGAFGGAMSNGREMAKRTAKALKQASTAFKAQATASKAAAAGSAAAAAAEAASAASTAASTTATAANSAATGANTAAKSGNAAATGALTAAQGAYTASTRAATAATAALGVVSKALPFAAVAAGAGVAVAAVAGLLEATNGATRNLGELTDASKDSQAAMERAEAEWHDAAEAHGELSEEALTAKAAFEAEKSSFEGSKQTLGEYAETLRDAADAHSELVDGISKTMDDAYAQAGAMESLVGQVRAADSLEAGADKTAQMRALTDQLNGSVEGLNASYDETTDSLSMSVDAMDALVEKQAQAARSEAAMKGLTDLLEEQISLQGDLAEAEAARERESSKDTVAHDMYGNAFTVHTDAWEAENDAVEANSAALEDNERKQAELKEQITEATKRQTALAAATKALNGDMSNAADVAAEYSERFGTQITEAEVMAEKKAELAQREQELQAEYEASIEKLSEYASENQSFKSALESSGYTVETLAQKLQDSGISVDEFTSGFDDLASKAQDGFSRMDDAVSISLDDMLANMQANTQRVQDWGDNLSTLMGMAGDDSQRAFIQYLGGLGPEYNNILQQLIDDGGAKLSEMSDQYEAGGAAAMDGMLTKVGAARDQVASDTDEIVSDVEGANASVNESISGMGAGVEGKVAEINGSIQVGAAQWATTLQSGFSALLPVAQQGGTDVVTYMADGMAASAHLVEEAAQAIADAAGGMTPGTDDAYGWGSDLASNFAAGMKDSAYLVSQAAAAIAEAAREQLHFTKPDKGPLSSGTEVYGRHLAANFAAGMRSNAAVVSNASRALASAATSAQPRALAASPRLDVRDRALAAVSSFPSPTVNVTVMSPDSGQTYVTNVGGITLEGKEAEGFQEGLERLVKRYGRLAVM